MEKSKTNTINVWWTVLGFLAVVMLLAAIFVKAGNLSISSFWRKECSNVVGTYYGVTPSGKYTITLEVESQTEDSHRVSDEFAGVLSINWEVFPVTGSIFCGRNWFSFNNTVGDYPNFSGVYNDGVIRGQLYLLNEDDEIRVIRTVLSKVEK